MARQRTRARAGPGTPRSRHQRQLRAQRRRTPAAGGPVRTVAAFLAGLVVGALLLAGGLAGAAVTAGQRGVVLRLDAQAIGNLLADAVREEVVAAVPAFLDRIRADLPSRVEREVQGSLEGFTLTVGEVTVELPERLRRALEAQIARQVQEVLETLLADVNPRDLADDLAGRARATVLSDMARHLRQALPRVEPLPGLVVPIVLDIR